VPVARGTGGGGRRGNTAGVQAIFGPGTNLADAADEVLRLLGHNKPPMDEAAE